MKAIDQIPEIDRKIGIMEMKINECSTKIIAIDDEIFKLQRSRAYQENKRRELGVELSKISTFKLDL